jgi:hypothetical protein
LKPDFENCTPELIKTFHQKISDLLQIEDSLSKGAQKEYGIREYSDWKECADEFERIMTKRAIQFVQIKW